MKKKHRRAVCKTPITWKEYFHSKEFANKLRKQEEESAPKIEITVYDTDPD